MRKIITDYKEPDNTPVDINRVSLEYAHVVAINKHNTDIKAFVLRYTDGLGLVFPIRYATGYDFTKIREKDLPSLIKRLKNDYDFYVL